MTDEAVLADEQALGELLAEYRGQGIASWIGKLIAGASFGLGGLGLIGWATYSLIRDLGNLAQDGPFLVFFMPGLLCFIGVAILPFGAWLFLGAHNSIGLRVRTYAGGFAVARRSRTDVFRWEDVSAFRIVPYVIGSRQTGRTNYLSYHVTRKDGLKAALDQANLPDAPAIGAQLVAKVSARLLPAAIEAFERGEELVFGEHQSELVVNSQGIQHRKGFLGWEEVADVVLDIKGNKLHILQRGAPGRRDRPWARLLLSTVPNAPVFVNLVEQVRSRPR